MLKDYWTKSEHKDQLRSQWFSKILLFLLLEWKILGKFFLLALAVTKSELNFLGYFWSTSFNWKYYYQKQTFDFLKEKVGWGEGDTKIASIWVGVHFKFKISLYFQTLLYLLHNVKCIAAKSVIYFLSFCFCAFFNTLSTFTYIYLPLSLSSF